ncbi:MAG: hypothetical protein ACM3XP_02080 [Nitrososphaerales archaeon]
MREKKSIELDPMRPSINQISKFLSSEILFFSAWLTNNDAISKAK